MKRCYFLQKFILPDILDTLEGESSCKGSIKCLPSRNYFILQGTSIISCFFIGFQHVPSHSYVLIHVRKYDIKDTMIFLRLFYGKMHILYTLEK